MAVMQTIALEKDNVMTMRLELAAGKEAAIGPAGQQIATASGRPFSTHISHSPPVEGLPKLVHWLTRGVQYTLTRPHPHLTSTLHKHNSYTLMARPDAADANDYQRKDPRYCTQRTARLLSN